MDQWLAQNYFVGDGETTVWEYSFASGRPDSNNGGPYIVPENVRAALSNVDELGLEERVPVDATPLGTNQLIISPAIADGQSFVIFRETEVENALVDYTDFSSISEKDLDTSYRQNLLLNQEVLDYSKQTRDVAIEARRDTAAALDVITEITGTEDTLVELVRRREITEADTFSSLANVNVDTGTHSISGAINARGAVFPSLDALKASTGIVVGAKVLTLGYVESGDGGGNYYEIVAAGTGTADGGSYIDLSGSGHQAKAISFVSSLELYVDPVGGDDLNTGASSSPFKTIGRAIDYVSQVTDIVQSEVNINLSAGTYPGQITVPRGLAQRFFLKFKGPGVGGPPNVPTAIIDFAADAGATRGLVSSGRNKVWIEDVKFSGAFPIAAQATLGTRFELRNVHVDGADTGIFVSNGSRYFIQGGIIENCTRGIEELFSCVRSHSSSVIRNCGTGVKAKENCSGHMSPLTIEDCDVGVELQAWSTANVGSDGGISVKRCTTGIVLTNSEIHNESPGIYGTGADANGVNLLSLGNSSEITSFGWQAGPPYNVRTGHRPQVPFYNDFSEITHSGTLTETTIYDTDLVLTQGVYSVTGKSFWFELTGTVPTTTAPILLRFRLAATFIGSYSIPVGSGTRGFHVKCRVISKTDGNSQLVRVEGFTNGGTLDLGVSNRAADLAGVNPRGLTVSAELSDASDSVTFLKGELMA